MRSRCEITKGGPHALSICLILAAVGLAVFSPAPGQVFGELAISEVDGLPANGAPPSPTGLENPAKNLFGLFSLSHVAGDDSSVRHPGHRSGVQDFLDSGLRRNDGRSAPTEIPNVAEASSAAEESGYTLSKEEYGQFRRLLSNTAATPVQIALTNTAVKGTNILLIGMAWLAFLWKLRRSWNFWFDADVYKKTWPSVVVICVLLICTVYLLGAAL